MKLLSLRAWRVLLFAALLASGPALAQTDAELKADLLQLKIVQAMEAGQTETALELFAEYDALGVAFPPPLLAPRARLHYQAGNFIQAEKILTEALKHAGRGSAEYDKLLPFLLDAQAKAKPQHKAIDNTIAALTPKCETQPKDRDSDDACWLKVDNNASCYVWLRGYLKIPQSVTWSGQCKNAKADGDGEKIDSWSEDGKVVQLSFSGSYQDGKQHGHWVERWADGNVFEGPFVDGKQHGHWVERWTNGNVHEGPYVDGKKHGEWVERDTNGVVMVEAPM